MTSMYPSWTWLGIQDEIELYFVNRSGRYVGKTIIKAAVKAIDAKTDPVSFQVTGSITLKCRMYPKNVLDELVQKRSECYVKYSFDHDEEEEKNGLLYMFELIVFPRGPMPTSYGMPTWPVGRPAKRVFLILKPVLENESEGVLGPRSKSGGKEMVCAKEYKTRVSVDDEIKLHDYQRVGIGSYHWTDRTHEGKDLDPEGFVVEEDQVVRIV